MSEADESAKRATASSRRRPRPRVIAREQSLAVVAALGSAAQTTGQTRGRWSYDSWRRRSVRRPIQSRASHHSGSGTKCWESTSRCTELSVIRVSFGSSTPSGRRRLPFQWRGARPLANTGGVLLPRPSSGCMRPASCARGPPFSSPGAQAARRACTRTTAGTSSSGSTRTWRSPRGRAGARAALARSSPRRTHRMRWTRGARAPSSCSSSPRATRGSVSSRPGVALRSVSTAMRTRSGCVPCCRRKVPPSLIRRTRWRARCRSVVSQWRPPPGRHPGVRRVLRYLRQAAPETDTSLAALAEIAGLSPGRFMHAFTETVRIPLRPYLRWLKLERAGAALAAGASLGEAAYGAGFADAAHMSRTFVRMFGVSPSDVRRRSQSVQDG